jgi:hypothetical protein
MADSWIHWVLKLYFVPIATESVFLFTLFRKASNLEI